MEFSQYVRAMGRGPGRARSLTREEARDAMARMLDGSAAPEAVGALLMLMRYRGEVPEEIAGFVEAARAAIAPWHGPRPALDWPSYAAGRTRSVPWFLLAARLVARAGHPVLLHGWNSHQNPVADIRAALPHAGIARTSWADAGATLARDGIAYVALEDFAPDILRLLRLRDVLGLRSAVNTTCRMLNPAGAASAVQGVFHPPYRELQELAADLLGQRNLTIIKGGGGEFERHPGKEIALYGLRDGREMAPAAPPVLEGEARRLAGEDYALGDLARLWRCELHDPFAEAVVTGTAALALDTLGAGGLDEARALWARRLDGAPGNGAKAAE